MEHFGFLDTISSKISQLQTEHVAISQLYSVVQNIQLIAMYKVLLAKFSQLKTSVKLHETNKDATMVKFRDNLEAYVTGLRVDVSNLKTKVSPFSAFFSH